jgi:tetratricopeptide (TPR) repeat protein
VQPPSRDETRRGPPTACDLAAAQVSQARRRADAQDRDRAVELLARAQARCPRPETLALLVSRLEAWAAAALAVGDLHRVVLLRHATARLLPTAGRSGALVDALITTLQVRRARSELQGLRVGSAAPADVRAIDARLAALSAEVARLAQEPDPVDAARTEARAAEGAALLQAGRLPEARRALEESLRLGSKCGGQQSVGVWGSKPHT